MTPGAKDISIVRGVDFVLPLQLVTSTGDAVDLTGRTFYAQIRNNSGEDLLANLTVTPVDLATGRITLSMTKANTAAISEKSSKWDLLSDASGTVEGPWIVGAVRISGTITQIP